MKEEVEMELVEILGAVMIVLVIAVFVYNIYVLLKGIKEIGEV